MKSLIMDKLFNRVEERGVVCVGLDTALEYIPSYLFEGRSEVEALVEFNKQIIDATMMFLHALRFKLLIMKH